DRLPPAHQVGQTQLDLDSRVDARAVEGRDSRGGAGERLVVEAGVLQPIAKPPLAAVLAALDVIDTAIHTRLRHVDPRVAGCPQGHDLADRDRDIAVLANGKVTPAAFPVLTLQDQVHGTLELD